ncbi:VIT1/CCC1 transporter family protein [Nocardioides sp. Iso805N]|uniref:VIT1/CCC1 transporter family protein n=1 Tax=Nocardioides sp. Iso805N TaxID=1283287 RepID=UPI00035F5B09|nr:VIT1/CCC1 transporter family protein [Nocardioides sp. Iso805N]
MTSTAEPRPGLLPRLRSAVSDRESLRLWRVVANDGIIATAGILEGFAGAGAGDHALLIAATAATIAGMLVAGGSEWMEAADEREAELTTAEEEAAQLARDPEAEWAELVAHYEARGLTSELARAVADQLMAHDPLAAQLDVEHGIRELTSTRDTVRTGVGSAIAYGLGAAIPLLITLLVPYNVEKWAIAAAVAISLTLTSIIGARTGRMNLGPTLLRTLTVGAATMLVSYAVGQLVF